METLTDQRRPCCHCGKLCRPTGQKAHERMCPANPDRRLSERSTRAPAELAPTAADVAQSPPLPDEPSPVRAVPPVPAHEVACPQIVDLSAPLLPVAAERVRDPSHPAVCCLRCRVELPSPRRLATHVELAHGAPALPRPLPAPVVVVEMDPHAPTCRCGSAFTRDPADPAGRCLKCSGAYARSLARRGTSYHAVAAAD